MYSFINKDWHSATCDRDEWKSKTADARAIASIIFGMGVSVLCYYEVKWFPTCCFPF